MPVGDDVSARGRGDVEVDGGFRGRVIERGYPMMHAVRPVVAGGGRAAIFIVGEDQTVCGFSAINDAKLQALAAPRGTREKNVEPFALSLVARRAAVNARGFNRERPEIEVADVATSAS